MNTPQAEYTIANYLDITATKATQSEFVKVKFDEIAGRGEFHLEWLSDNQISIAINDRRFLVYSESDLKLSHDFPPKPNAPEE